MKPRLFLIDAHSYIHRAYHALPPLTTSKGLPVGALYGFARMLLKLLREESPDAACACFDSPGPTFRHKLFPQYKGTRKEIDEDLKRQLEISRDVAQALGFSIAALPGYEADDLLATLAKTGRDNGFEVALVTSDKDALQLVGPGVKVYNAAKGAWMAEDEVRSKFGVPPRHIVDYLAIAGDNIDNIPGVRGIGPVGAKNLVNRYGGVESILRAARQGDARIPPKALQSLRDSEETLEKAKALIALKEDAPIDLPRERLRPPRPDLKALPPLFERLEFHSLLKEVLGGDAPAGNGGNAEPEPAHAYKESGWDKFLAAALKSPEYIAMSGWRLDEAPADGESFAAAALPDGQAAFLDDQALSSRRRDLERLLSSKAEKAAYDLKETLKALGPSAAALKEPYGDARLAQYCLNPSQAKAPALKSAKEWRGALAARLEKASLWPDLKRRMRDAGVLKLYEEIELPLVAVLKQMEETGIAVDGDYLKSLAKKFDAQLTKLRLDIDSLAGSPVNPNSPQQLAALLFDKLRLPVAHKTQKGKRSTDEEALRALGGRHPVVEKLLAFRELSKFQSTYVDGLLSHISPRDGRVHTRFDQALAETGRLSSSNPNLQNIPIRTPLGLEIRRAFAAEKGHLFVSADYSQIDLRVLAHVSGDKGLRDAFERGEDVHARTASEVFHVPPDSVSDDMRRKAKAVNFGLAYGQTPFGLSQTLGIPQPEAAAIIARYFERYSGVKRWIDENLEAAREAGFVRTFLGRVRYLPELKAQNTALRQYAERAATNTPIQGGSADIIKLAMIKFHRERSAAKSGPFHGARMLLQIHDELLFEVPTADVPSFCENIRSLMEGAAELSVPLRADVAAGPDWGDMEAVEA
jgi:DNA polymerase-1